MRDQFAPTPIFEHNTPASLLEALNKIQTDGGKWGAVVIKRRYLQTLTNEAFVMAIRPILQEGAEEAHIGFLSGENIYLLWNGKQKLTYKLLTNLLTTSLIHPGLTVSSKNMANYFLMSQKHDELKGLISSEKSELAADDDRVDLDDIPDDDEPEDEIADGQSGAASVLRVSPEQIRMFNETKSQKPYRRQLQFLVAEDQLFAQKLLCEILRSVRVRNDNESPFIDAVQSLQSAWKIFLKKAPDILFIDLNLTDGSGHTLARAIKEVDPNSQVIIITANHHEDEIKVARQNNVDGFITKPYNKKQIMDVVTRYYEGKMPKGAHRGISGKL